MSEGVWNSVRRWVEGDGIVSEGDGIVSAGGWKVME